MIHKLNAAAKAGARAPDFIKKGEHEGLVISAGAPAELDTYVRGEQARWGRIVEDNNLKAD